MVPELHLIYILYGADDYSIHQALAAIKKGLGDPETLATNTTRLEGDRLPPAALQAAVEAYPFFGDRRLVIVEGLLGRFESKSKSPASEAKTPKKTEADPVAFAGVLKSAPPTTVAVLIDGELKKTNPMLKELAGKAEVKEYPPLSMNRLTEWIKKRAAESGGSISDEAAALLSRLVGSNLWTMAGEISKLTLLAEGRRIETADVESAVSASTTRTLSPAAPANR